MRLAFVGKMRAGKDTAAEYLKKTYLPNALILKFADPLYEIEKMLYNYVGYPIPSDKQKRRGLLQYIGTDWGREILDPNIWIKHLESRIKYIDDDILITDARFPNEVEMLANNGFEIVQIVASEKNRIARGASNLTHESETALDNFSFDTLNHYSLINNDRMLENYYNSLDKMYQLWKFDAQFVTK